MAGSPEANICFQLIDVAKKLRALPPSDNGALAILESLEDLLNLQGQTSSQAILDALCQVKKGLMSEKVFKHYNFDVKVSVMYCIHSIITNTAPEEPFSDNCMKEIFNQTINNVFGNLPYFSGSSKEKVFLILYHVAKVRSSLILLDLGCTELITEMFQIFLDTIRLNHPNDVFSSMEEIMSTLIQESDEVSFDLLKPLFAVINKANEITLPPSRRLAAKVLKNCSEKVKPYLTEYIESRTYILNSIWPAEKNVTNEEASEIRGSGSNASPSLSSCPKDSGGRNPPEEKQKRENMGKMISLSEKKKKKSAEDAPLKKRKNTQSDSGLKGIIITDPERNA